MSNKKYYISKFNCSSSVLAHTFVLLLFAFNSEHFFLFPYLIPSVAQILFFPSFVPYFYFFYFYFISFSCFEILVYSSFFLYIFSSYFFLKLYSLCDISVAVFSLVLDSFKFISIFKFGLVCFSEEALLVQTPYFFNCLSVSHQ